MMNLQEARKIYAQSYEMRWRVSEILCGKMFCTQCPFGVNGDNHCCKDLLDDKMQELEELFGEEVWEY